MRQYIARRLLAAALTMFLLSIATFVVLRVLAPGDPALMRLGTGATQEQLDATHERMGLNDPMVVQYLRWTKQLVSFDLGESSFNGESVAMNIRNRLPVSAELLVLTMALTVAIGMPFGVVAAVYRNSLLDYGTRLTAIFGLSIPAFWVATLMLLVPNEVWGYAPPIGKTVALTRDPLANLRQFGPPALVLALAPSATVLRFTRSALLEVLGQDYVRTARAKGLRERVVVSRHALRNALVPVVTVLGLQFAALLGGAVIIEQIFTLNGMGRYLFESIYRGDYQVVQTLTLFVACAVILTNLAVDVAYVWLDPRIRYA